VQPDLVLYRLGLWRWHHPAAADISLLIEINESSLTFDLGGKLALYKNAGIKEYWVIDLNAKQLHCFVALDGHESLFYCGFHHRNRISQDRSMTRR
jgi:Uma2 family endonuclease